VRKTFPFCLGLDAGMRYPSLPLGKWVSTEAFVERKKLIAWGTVILVATLAIAGSYLTRFAFERRTARGAAPVPAQVIAPQAPSILYSSSTIPRGIPFATMLTHMGIDPLTTARIVASTRSVFNFRMFQAGNELTIGRSVAGELLELRYQIDPERFLSIVRRNAQFEAEVETIPSTVETDAVAGKIDGSLFDGVKKAGETPELAMRLADIFSWDLDFYTDPRPGDTFRLVVEKKVLANGTTLSYGKILAAEYDNDGRVYRAVLFHDPSGAPAYYTPDGKSLKKAFLHSPLKFSAVITSHFSYHRFHPILKMYRPHLGTDYGAPMGTPVQSIGDGRVIFAGRKGEDGNLVKIQHINGYDTYYMHLSRVLVRDGQRVVQGQRIGLVGMTGLATGPHLDFRIERHGQFMNFERLPLPPSQPVARRDRTEFEAVCDREMSLLPVPGASVASAASLAAGALPTTSAPH
ncbi:MAG TPA: peptidoglycan DD-metalloendopeptidase family protein, partial [Candidatus Acidoferrales bacterium]|nr:peptidoglycan DD-metalloendopeptidase family protein [Candidatus Acidoferrales bacterium]